jgi:thiamine kinase-like enzyme
MSMHSIFKKSNSILEQFIENSTTLPDDLFKNMTIMRELDEKVNGIIFKK